MSCTCQCQVVVSTSSLGELAALRDLVRSRPPGVGIVHVCSAYEPSQGRLAWADPPGVTTHVVHPPPGLRRALPGQLEMFARLRGMCRVPGDATQYVVALRAAWRPVFVEALTSDEVAARCRGAHESRTAYTVLAADGDDERQREARRALRYFQRELRAPGSDVLGVHMCNGRRSVARNDIVVLTPADLPGFLAFIGFHPGNGPSDALVESGCSDEHVLWVYYRAVRGLVTVRHLEDCLPVFSWFRLGYLCDPQHASSDDDPLGASATTIGAPLLVGAAVANLSPRAVFLARPGAGTGAPDAVPLFASLLRPART
jgi:hypothetical protein